MSNGVRLGLSLPNRAVLFGVEAGTLLETAEQADKSGVFDSVWVGDNLLSKPRLEALVTLAGIASRTREVKLGTICLASFVLRHPVTLAVQWASLDVLSGGRTILGVCSGPPAKAAPKFASELATMGVASKDRLGRLEEGIPMLRAMWSSPSEDFHGEHFSIEGQDVLPKPIGHPPIHIAVNPPRTAKPEIEERAMRRVARLANGWQVDSIPPPDFNRRWSMIQEFSAEYGREGEVTDAALHLMVNINPDRSAAVTEAKEFLSHYYGETYITEDLLRVWLAAGSPDEVAERILSYTEAGCNMPVVRFVAPNQQEQLELFIDNVAPLIAGSRE